METQENSLTVINPNIPQNFLQTLPTVLQVALRTSGEVTEVSEVVSLVDEPKLAKLKKVGGEVPTYNTVRLLLVAMSMNLHIDNGLTEANINSIAKRLTTDPEITWWLTLADIDLLCRRIVDGDYGPYYNRFGVDTFNGCLGRYCKERTEIHAVQNDREVEKPDVAVVKEVGYKIDGKGNIVISDAAKGKGNFAQPQYLYDDYGRRVGVNPKWKGPGTEDPSMRAAMKIYKRALVIQEEQGCELKDALMLAKKEQERGQGWENS